VADLSDVEQAIENLITGLIYPNGSSQLSALPGATTVTIGRGWPQAADLDAAMLFGKAIVSIFSKGQTGSNTTRYPVDYQEVSRQTATVSATVSGNQITIAGTYSAGVTQFVTLQIGQRTVISYMPVQGDTANSIAAALASLISSTIAPASANGAVVTVTTGMPIRAIVGVTGTQIAEVAREQTQVVITLWCPTPTVRDNIAKLIEPTLRATTFLIMPDQSAARFRYHNTFVNDGGEKVQIYRRDLNYVVEYATTLIDAATEVTSTTVNNDDFNNGIGTAQSAPTVPTTYPIPGAPAPGNARTPFVPKTPN
jgi:hypothetical protein